MRPFFRVTDLSELSLISGGTDSSHLWRSTRIIPAYLLSWEKHNIDFDERPLLARRGD
jgi:hypothetical protein